MARILVAVLGLAAVSAALYLYLSQGLTKTAQPQSPQRALENVRVKAKDIESDAQRRADESLKLSDPARN
jgi:Ni/Co efflux regulator RcnB